VLAEEKSVLAEEKSVLAEEKSVLAEEKSVLAEEKSVLAEEKSLLLVQNNSLLNQNTALVTEFNKLKRSYAVMKTKRHNMEWDYSVMRSTSLQLHTSHTMSQQKIQLLTLARDGLRAEALGAQAEMTTVAHELEEVLPGEPFGPAQSLLYHAQGLAFRLQNNLYHY
jgi:hypothetical protein